MFIVQTQCKATYRSLSIPDKPNARRKRSVRMNLTVEDRGQYILVETARLLLRNVAAKDAEIMYDYRNNEICARYQRGQVKDLDDIVALVERRKDDAVSVEAPFMVAVALKDTDEMVGEIVVMPNDGTISLGCI